MSDNGPQYSSQDFAQFSNEWGFRHTTSSPYHTQSNVFAEKTVQTAKQLLFKARKERKAHISASWSIAIHRSPVASPAQLLLNRRLRSILPYTGEQLKPKTIDMSRTKSVLAREKLHQKKNYDKHPSKHLQPMHVGDPVIVRKRW